VENLLEFANRVQNELDSAKENFAKKFVEYKLACFDLYQKGIVTSASHGIDFFKNVISYWDNPDQYVADKEAKLKQEGIKDKLDVYEHNFVKILKANK